MAGLGTKLWTSGEVVTAAGVNGYLQDQTIGKFATTTARDAAFGGAGEPTLSEGMFAYTTDTNTLWFYTGSAWQNVLGSNIGEISTSNRNAVINGAMQIWQRGTSFSSLGFTSYTADRMFFFCGSNINRTVTRQNTSDTTNLPNLFYCARVQRTAAATDTNATNISQSFESSNSVQFSGKSVTFSFYARAGANFSAASSTLTATVRSGTGADENIANGFTGSTNVVALTATLTTTWQRFTFTGTVAATATQLGWIIGYTPVGTAGANDYFEVTGVQLEAGSVATPFEFEQISETLAKCQRYYEKSYAQATVPGTAISDGAVFGSGLQGTATTLQYMMTGLKFIATKRTAATVTVYDRLGNINKVSADDTANAAFDNQSAAVAAQGQAGCRIDRITGGAANLLTFQYTASAEL